MADKRDRPPAGISHNVYWFYDVDGRLLYIGATSVGLTRWLNHSAFQPWWPLVATARVEHFPSRSEALAAERAAIRLDQPAHNAVRYTQRPLPSKRYRRHHEGSVYFIARSERWCASIRINGKRHFATANKDRAVVEAWLEAIRREHGYEAAA